MSKKGPKKKRKACAYVHTYMPTATAVAAHAGLYDAVPFHADTCGMHCSHQHQQCPLFELLVQNLLILSKIFLHLSYETTYLVRPHCMQGLGSISKKCEYLLEVLNYVNSTTNYFFDVFHIHCQRGNKGKDFPELMASLSRIPERT